MSDKREFVLWGFLPGRVTYVCRLTTGTVRTCNAESKRRTAAGWVCGTYLSGDAPEGVQAQLEAQQAS